jgi:hypothetical protein
MEHAFAGKPRAVVTVVSSGYRYVTGAEAGAGESGSGGRKSIHKPRRHDFATEVIAAGADECERRALRDRRCAGVA